jgi:uncharacterized protein
MSKSIMIADALSTDIDLKPMAPDWILAGAPESGGKRLAASHDGTSAIVVWECTAGRFKWIYSEDETAVVIAGEVFITTDKGEERRLGQGDMAFFPAGTWCIWHVNDRIRKVAVLRRPLPLPLGFGVRAWSKLLNTLGLKGESPPTLAGL